MKSILVVTTLVAVAFIGTSAHARAWKRHKAEKQGFSLLIPRGATVTDKTLPDKWTGLQAEHKGIKLFAVAQLGKKNTAATIEALGDRISGMDRKHWTVKKTRKAKGGWVWYNIAKGVQGKKAAFAVYGIGRRGTFLVVLLTTAADARKNWVAYARWSRGVLLK